HFAAAPEMLPQTALAAGADACVQSAHKTLSALTQGAYLHVSQRLIDLIPSAVDQIRAALRVFMTSSPSFVIGASLDYARADLAANGHAKTTALLQHIREFASQLTENWQLSTPTTPTTPSTPTMQEGQRDPLRLVLRNQTSQVPATHLAKQLSDRGIDIEMADLTRLVLIPALDTPKSDFEKLAMALNSLNLFDTTPSALNYSVPDTTLFDEKVALEQQWLELLMHPAEKILPAGEVLFGAALTETIPLSHAANKIAATPISPYPPGIPLILPGERIDVARLDLLLRLQDNEITLAGVDRGTIRVVV
ncbi:MAG: hypothetical protein PHC86_08585, partial [Eubacteriales bacterium]|nr:hypothetical protein [Eubacteriales bacterium]